MSRTLSINIFRKAESLMKGSGDAPNYFCRVGNDLLVHFDFELDNYYVGLAIYHDVIGKVFDSIWVPYDPEQLDENFQFPKKLVEGEWINNFLN